MRAEMPIASTLSEPDVEPSRTRQDRIESGPKASMGNSRFDPWRRGLLGSFGRGSRGFGGRTWGV